MSAKKISVRSAILSAALLLAAAGCTPAGPRALLNGKKDLDAGDSAAAVRQLETATELLPTNAAAWNYFGVALQRAGQADAAALAYKRALDLNRDLLEARFNLGVLQLEQNRADEAKAELTAYTLRRPNDAAGWLKLGSAQLRLGDTVPAERSFSAVLALKTSEAEAYNGLGLARVQRGRPREAAQFFTAAVQARRDFAPAILNLAAVNQQYLHDNKTALENYRAYLALSPRPANWEEVNTLADGIEREQAAIATAAKPPAPAPSIPIPPAEPKPQPKIIAAVTPKPVPAPRPVEPKPVVQQPKPVPEPVVPPAPAQVVQVAPEPQIVATPGAAAPAAPPVEAALPAPAPEPKPGVWSKLFGSAKPETAATNSPYIAAGVTPLPGTVVEPPAPKPVPVAEVKPPQPPVAIVPPAPVNFPRYNYISPARPAPGDRHAANLAFIQARMAEQDGKWGLALECYRQAAAQDPAWFEAQFNSGVIAHRLRSYALALACYETALALQPNALDARYNFALALKAAGYAPDAAAELKKILAANPGEVRAHLALANLCAQTLRDPVQARAHYQKVLELDPKNPQTADIRFWLAANPG